MELWDVLNDQGEPTGRFIVRGSSMKPTEYHLVVHVWIKNDHGDYLIQKRTANKTYPLMWAITGGSAITGDNSLQTALKEAREQLGIELDPSRGKFILRLKRQLPNNPDFLDVWLFNHSVAIDRLFLQPDEVCDVKWASMDEIRSMIQKGEFISEYPYLDQIN